MMSKKRLVYGYVVRALIALGFLGGLSVQVGVNPALALGTPQIVSVNPGSGASVGSTVCIRARIDNDPEYRAMKIWFGNEGQESSEYEFERCFGTGHLSAGWYTIRVEAARLNDTSWSSPTSTEMSYQLTASAPPPEPTQPSSPPKGPNVSVIDLSPGGSAEIGTQVSIHIVVDSSNPGAVRVTVSCGGVQHVEHTVPDFSTTWYTDTCSPGSQSVRVCARDVNDPNWANASCADRGYSLWAEPSSPRPTANLWADSESIQAGQCTVLHWTTTGASRVELDSETVSGSGDRQVCPNITKHYNLRATGDGGEANDNVSVYVTSSPPQAQVVDSFKTGDVIDIDGNIYVIVDRQRRHVPNPETLDALGIPRSWVNNRGFSASQLRSILEGSDIPDVNRDRSGFDAFKHQYFPNTSPIIPATATPRSSQSVPSGRPWVSVGQSSVQAGGNITASWGGLNVTGNDWITIHRAGESDEKYTGWDFVRSPSGTITLIAPTETGWYDLQLYREWVKIATSSKFEVVDGFSQSEPQEAVSGTSYGCGGSLVNADPTLLEQIADLLDITTYADHKQFTDSEQCVFYAAARRPDALTWLRPQYADAHVWDQDAASAGLWVSRVTDDGFSVSQLHYNDIVVWEQTCGGPFTAHGHVAVIDSIDQAAGTFDATEVNGLVAGEQGPREDVRPASCMAFIHNPGETPPSQAAGSTGELPIWMKWVCALHIGSWFDVTCP